MQKCLVSYRYCNDLTGTSKTFALGIPAAEQKIADYMRKNPQVKLRVFKTLANEFWVVLYATGRARKRLVAIRAEAVGCDTVEQGFEQIARVL